MLDITSEMGFDIIEVPFRIVYHLQCQQKLEGKVNKIIKPLGFEFGVVFRYLSPNISNFVYFIRSDTNIILEFAVEDIRINIKQEFLGAHIFGVCIDVNGNIPDGTVDYHREFNHGLIIVKPFEELVLRFGSVLAAFLVRSDKELEKILILLDIEAVAAGFRFPKVYDTSVLLREIFD
jgi:hypothetical protein